MWKHFETFLVSIAIIKLSVPADAQKTEKPTTDKGQQPTIITKDGSIIFQSALNGNISFALNGENADVKLGQASLKELIKTVKQQSDQIELLNKGKALCTKELCGKNGKCQVSNGRIVCICSGNWFGAYCDIPKPKKCEFNLKGKSGLITSPGFPKAYPANQECVWTISATPGYLIHLDVTAYIGNSIDCSDDFLQVKDEATSMELGKMCGSIQSKSHFTASNRMVLKLKGGSRPIGSGFLAIYSEIKNEKCGGRLTKPGELITSTDVTDLPCIWVVETSSEGLTLTFTRLKITNPPGSCENYLEVRNGVSYDSPVFERICHANDSLRILNTGSSKLFIQFVRKNNSNGDLVRGTFDVACGGAFDLQIGERFNITSPFYPRAYPSSKRCVWIFHSPRSTLLQFRFLDFGFDAVGYRESVFVRDGHYGQRFYGNSFVVPVTSVISRMDVEYITSGSTTSKGFRAEVMAVDGSCTKSVRAVTGSLFSPHYPSEYSNNLNCVYTLISSNYYNNAIQLSFVKFDLEDDPFCMKDYVQFFDGISTDSPLIHGDIRSGGRFCGDSLPPVTVSSGRALTVRFHSNANSTKRNMGFLADWNAIRITPKAVDCDVQLKGNNGTFQSPGYPARYRPNLNCSIKIEAPNGRNIKLDFLIFDIYETTSCFRNYLQIHDGPDEKSRVLGKYCGQSIPRFISSSGNFMFLRFRTYTWGQGAGFRATYTTGTNLCGAMLTGIVGNIQSPGYPLAYRPNQECYWIITAEDGFTISVTVNDLEIEDSKNCTNDYFKIYDGHNAGGKLLGTLCGNLRKKTYRSSGRYLYIKFKTNDAIQWKGFSLKYQQGCSHYLHERKGQIMSPGYPNPYPRRIQCRWIILAHPKDVVKITAVDFQLHRAYSYCYREYIQFFGRSTRSPRYCKGKPSFSSKQVAVLKFYSRYYGLVTARGFKFNYVIDGCGKDADADTGNFSTPNYPNSYAKNEYCMWRIRVSEKKRVKLMFSDIDVEECTTTGGVQVYNGYGPAVTSLVGKYCSKRKAFNLTLMSNEVTLIFKSSAAVIRRNTGFTVKYITLPDGCGGTYTAHAGSIHSPGFPAKYPVDSLCEWTISTKNSERVIVTIPKLDLENHSTCSDYLEFTDAITFQVLAKLCGNKNTPTTISSSGDMMRIKFVSDSSNSNGSSFSINYKTACGGIVNVTDTPGYIMSPNYPSFYDSVQCVWLLTTTPGKRINLQYIDFDIEECSRCYCDSLTIHDGTSNSSSVMDKVCGTRLPANKISTGNNLYIVFKTNNRRHQRGFKLKHSADISACGGRLKSISGTIITPFYPNKSPSQADCVWTIEVSQGSKVELYFSRLQLGSDCSSSYVKIFNGSTTGSSLLMKTLCSGSVVTSYKSTSNFMTLQFVTNVPTIGFMANFKTNCLDSVLTAPSGYIESPGYPNFYSKNLRCIWKIAVPKGKQLSITKEAFDLEPPFRRRYCRDYLYLRNGASGHRVSPYFCGTHMPNSFKMTYASSEIRFFTDATVNRPGFRLKYKIDDVVPVCGGTFTATKAVQYLKSPNYPGHYPSHTTCQWNIESKTPGTAVKLQFIDFVLESSLTCSFDYVSVKKDDTSVAVKYCGRNRPSVPIISNGQKIVVVFRSDYDGNHKGFNASFQSVCESFLTATKGTVRSYRDTNTSTYLPNSDCMWEIVHSQGGIISVNFTKLNLEKSTNCTKDYVLVRNGISGDSPVLGRYCNNTKPFEIVSTGHEMTIQLVTDGTGQIANGGFELSYERKILGCGGVQTLSDATQTSEILSPGYPKSLPDNTECEWTLNAPEFSVIDLTFTSLNLTSTLTNCATTYLLITNPDNGAKRKICDAKSSLAAQRTFIRSSSNILKLKLVTGTTRNAPLSFKASWKIDCGGHFVSASGNFTSRNFPNAYPNKEDCLYTIELLDKSKQVQLHFPVFKLQPAASGNRGDYIKVFDGVTTTSSLIGTYNSASVPSSIVSSANTVSVQFMSDAVSGTTDGFRAEYSTFGTACGGRLNRAGGFTTPSYPNNYPAGRRCRWVLQSVDFAVQLTVTNLDMASSVNCTEDYLLIRNGEAVDSPVLGRYCGKRKDPLIVYSTGFVLVVEFVSNRDNARGKGFNAQFKSKHPACGGQLTGDGGIISTPFFPGYYKRNMNCEWLITAKDKNHIVQLDFKHFELEYGSRCQFDYLEIRSGLTSDAPLVRKLCGTVRNLGIIATSGPNVYLRFVSDSSFSKKGFNLTWNADSPRCGGIIRGLNGEIKSPGYPNSYTVGNHGDCFWIGALPSGYEALLTVVDFQLPSALSSGNCSVNRVLVQNGRNPDSPVLATLCGNITDRRFLKLSGSNFRIHMISDNTSFGSSDVYKFKIAYSIKQLGCGGVIEANRGIITSPQYPANYNKGLECEWVIRTASGTNINLYVDDLKIMHSINCANHFVEIRDGRDRNAALLDRVCGNHITVSSYISQSNEMYLRFVTNSVGRVSKGFKFEFNTGCGGILKGRTGFAKTPNYPLQYPINQDCRWILDVQTYFKITLTDVMVNLPGRQGQCKGDRVEVRAGRALNSSLLQTLCGNYQQQSMDIDYNELLVRFISDNVNDSTTNAGASVNYTAACGHHIKNSRNGTIDMRFEGGGGGYHHNENCEWLIEFPANKKITLESTFFALERGFPLCVFDSLEIWDGRNSTAPLIGTWCGTTKPPHIQSSSNYLFIRFKTDAGDSGYGFQFRYSEAPLSCGGNLAVGMSGSTQFSSPNYPGTLKANQVCGWKLTAPQGTRINITFSELNLRTNTRSSCIEYVLVYEFDYPNEKNRRTGAICGRRSGSLLVASNVAYIVFKSSISGRASPPLGFKASFQVAGPACGGLLNVNDTDRTLAVSGLTNGQNCEWLLKAPRDNKITIKFTEFNVGKQNSDKSCTRSLNVRDRFLLLGQTFCGDKLPNVHHGSLNILVIRLTNASSADKFTLKYSTREDCDMNYTAANGFVTSLNYPKPYPNNMDCNLLISTSVGKIITLYSYDLNIEPPPFNDNENCRFDKLNIYDGDNITSPKLDNDTICGRRIPPTYQSSGNTMLLHFHTDFSLQHSGFAFTYVTSARNVCGGDVNGPKGAITSPSHPLYYGDAVNCEWRIIVSPGKRVKFNVGAFQLENSSGCSTDYVEVFDGTTKSWGKFCGSGAPAGRTTTSNRLRVVFKSNDNHNDFSGFKLFFEEV